eukprot:2254288-Rhodomonas_salina.2
MMTILILLPSPHHHSHLFFCTGGSSLLGRVIVPVPVLSTSKDSDTCSLSVLRHTVRRSMRPLIAADTSLADAELGVSDGERGPWVLERGMKKEEERARKREGWREREEEREPDSEERGRGREQEREEKRGREGGKGGKRDGEGEREGETVKKRKRERGRKRAQDHFFSPSLRVLSSSLFPPFKRAREVQEGRS